ncbi:hypothetical protein GCM10027398_43770 [Azotobacter salinestris]
MKLARGRPHASQGVRIRADIIRSPGHAQMRRLPLWLGPQGLKKPPEHAREHRWAGLTNQTHQSLQNSGTAPDKDSPGASTASSAECRDGRNLYKPRLVDEFSCQSGPTLWKCKESAAAFL